MASVGAASPSPAASAAPGAGPAGAAADAAAGRALHQRSFKLRFAAQREQGRSYVSPVKPLGLPATVTDKFYSRARGAERADAAAERALRRIQDMFARGPADKYAAPVTSAHEYGWHRAAPGPRADRRLAHHVRDSAWLKARLLVLAADDKLKHK